MTDFMSKEARAIMGNPPLTEEMTMRDWFAATCPHDTATIIVGRGVVHNATSIAQARYVYADEMLKARGGL